ncbi:hypothetical protein H6G89_33040 [Oscillatoria sp. FACHB-1407]|uniref:hypothetical protein n=1 Tax=Oscillatoria sp. FACHB-1407 TaxID=2692847 RepID=UPI0016841F45|nr:hypothetical protein [Oscillatoria sp. FACHB-1407]MBD2465816.1 hypothetical protein [Oscillatoria sp. FACHB-1407]
MTIQKVQELDDDSLSCLPTSAAKFHQKSLENQGKMKSGICLSEWGTKKSDRSHPTGQRSPRHP